MHLTRLVVVLDREYPDQICSVARALEVVGERWTLLIIRDISLGVNRFDALAESLGLSRNLLKARLDHLIDEGVLERRRYQERPERYEYVLTPKGRGLWPAVFHLMKWGDENYSPAVGVPRVTLHRGCGGEVDAKRVCDRCHEQVPFEAIELVPGPALTTQTR